MSYLPLNRLTSLAAFVALTLLLTACPSRAQTEATEPDDDAMSIDRIELIISRLDEEYQRQGNSIMFVYAERQILLVSDPEADRMRVMIPVNDAAALDEEELMRLMQANFDSALDARYAIAKGTLWSAFIHPLASLDDQEFLLGLGQVVNLANTFGGAYSSGLLMFGGGDSRSLRERELIDELVRKGLAI